MPRRVEHPISRTCSEMSSMLRECLSLHKRPARKKCSRKRGYIHRLRKVDTSGHSSGLLMRISAKTDVTYLILVLLASLRSKRPRKLRSEAGETVLSEKRARRELSKTYVSLEKRRTKMTSGRCKTGISSAWRPSLPFSSGPAHRAACCTGEGSGIKSALSSALQLAQ